MRFLISDLRYAIRGLLRHRGFTLVAVLTSSLGIGANSAIFSVVRGVLLSALPYGDSDRLVFFWNQFPAVGENELPLSHAELVDWRAQTDVFEGMAGLTTGEQNFLWTLETEDGRTEKYSGAMATANLFDVLGVEAALGRTFLPVEETRGNNLVMVLSDAFWRSRFNVDPSLTHSRA